MVVPHAGTWGEYIPFVQLIAGKLTLDFLPSLFILKVAGGKLPAHLLWWGGVAAFFAGQPLLFLSFNLIISYNFSSALGAFPSFQSV